MKHLFIALLLTVNLLAADVPLGHKDFYPSPDWPVGFRGDGTGCYPGATLVEHFDERTGNNILWKVEMPSWGHAGLIVVGDKVITTGEPWMVYCHSAKDGKLLWQRELNPFAAAGLTGKELADATEMMEVVLATRTIGWMMFNVFRTKFGGYVSKEELEAKQKRMTPARWEQAIAYLQNLKRVAAKWAPQSAAGFDALIAEYENYRAAGAADGIERAYQKVLMKTLPRSPKGVPLTATWYTMVGFTYPTPVTDGRHVFVSMGQGQVGAFDLDGNLVWQMYQDPTDGRNSVEPRVNHVPSPLLVGDRLVVQFEKNLAGLDKRTGKVVWTDEQKVGGGYNCGTHRVLRLPVSGQEPLPVVVTTSGRVLRAVDGKLLCQIDARMCGSEAGGNSVPALGNIVVYEQGNNGGGEWKAFELIAGSRDVVEAKLLWSEQRSNSRHANILLPDRFIKAGLTEKTKTLYIYDPRTGASLGTVAAVRLEKGVSWVGEVGSASVLVGNRVLLTGAGGWGYHRQNPDGSVYVGYTTVGLDGKAISSKVSVLGGMNKPRYPLVEKYMPEWYQEGILQHQFMPAAFSLSHSGPVPHGDRLYIRSTSHLYCIGKR